MRIAIVISLFTVALTLYFLSRIPRFHEALGIFDKIGSILAAIVAMALLVLPSDTTSVQNFPAAGPVPINATTPSYAPSRSPASTPTIAVSAIPSPSVGLADETVEVEENDTKWILNKEISISVNDIGYQTVTATIGIEGGAPQVVKEKGVGYVALIKGKKVYRVTIAKIEVIGSRVRFRVTSNPN